MKIIREIYVTKARRIEPISVVYGNDKVPIELDLMDFDLVSGATIKAYAKGENSSEIYETTCTHSANEITFTPPAGFFVPGKNKLQIDATMSGAHLITFRLDVLCDEEIAAGEPVTPPESVKTYAERAEAAADRAEEVEASIPLDYSELSEMATQTRKDLEEVDSRLSESITEISDNLKLVYNCKKYTTTRENKSYFFDFEIKSGKTYYVWNRTSGTACTMFTSNDGDNDLSKVIQSVGTINASDTPKVFTATSDAKFIKGFANAFLEIQIIDASSIVFELSETVNNLGIDVSSLQLNALQYKGNIQSVGITDLNEAKKGGIYRIGDYTNIQNIPLNKSGNSQTGTLIVFSDNTATPRLVQMYLGSDGILYYRKAWNGSFVAWRRIAMYDEIEAEISRIEQKVTETDFDFGFIQKFAVIGDSYSSGEIYVADSSAEKGYTVADYYNLSWGQIIARKYGSACINMSVGGLTTRTWLTNAKGLSLLNSSEAQQLYMIALGHNDEGNSAYGINYLGTPQDLTSKADTFYGNYAKIIDAIKTKAPNSKIVLLTVAYLYNSVEDSFNTAIKNIASFYGLPCIDIKEDDFYAKNSIYHTGKMWDHPTAPIYSGMAKANAKLFNKIVKNNYDYFKDFIG